MGYAVIHKKEVRLNKKKLDEILTMRNLDYTELFNRVEQKFGLNLKYKGFMTAISNRSTWKLLYAWAIADVLDIDIRDIFEVFDVDIEEKIKEKEKWKEKYEKRRNSYAFNQ